MTNFLKSVMKCLLLFVKCTNELFDLVMKYLLCIYLFILVILLLKFLAINA